LDLQKFIDHAKDEPDATLCNLYITLAHLELSERLRKVIGDDAGANFHSWAVWGSKKAGVTIRQEDLDEALRNATFVSGLVGLMVGCGAALAVLSLFQIDGFSARPDFIALGGALGASIGAVCGRAIARWSRKQAAAIVLAGNRLVLDDIGRQTARFCDAFTDKEIDHTLLEAFLEEMLPGPAEDGGQDLLRDAFRLYAYAASERDIAKKHEAVYFANCLAILNEHQKLQPYIEKSMPFIVQKCVTERMLSFDIGPLRLAVGADVPPLDGKPFPDTLAKLQSQGLLDFLADYGKKSDTLAGSRARNWSLLNHRMGYIVKLFRCYHLDASVFHPPYTSAQTTTIRTGRVPAGRL